MNRSFPQTRPSNREEKPQYNPNIMLGYAINFSILIIGIILFSIYYNTIPLNYGYKLCIISFMIYALSLIFSSFIQHYRLSSTKKNLTHFTPSHFFFHFMITIMMYYFITPNIFIAIFVSILFAVIWEIIENGVGSKYPDLPEDLKGRLFDIFTAVLGTSLALIFIH